MDKHNWFFKQVVAESELDQAFDDVERGLNQLRADHHGGGVVTGLEVTPASPASLAVRVAAGTALVPASGGADAGARVPVATLQTVSLATAEGGGSTAVTTPGNSRLVDLYLKFARALSDDRVDGNALPIKFRVQDSFALRVLAGAEGVSPSPPADPADGSVLLARVTLIFGQTTILAGDINVTVADRDTLEADLEELGGTLSDAQHGARAGGTLHPVGTGTVAGFSQQNFLAADKVSLDGLTTGAAQAVRKDGSVAFTGAQSLGGQRLTNVGAPTAGTDAVPRDYVDDRLTGLDKKHSVRAATTGPLPASVAAGAGVGKTLTASANGALTVDGVTGFADLDTDGKVNDPFAVPATTRAARVLVKDEVTAANNGLYAVKARGSATTPWILVRAADADGAGEVTGSLYTWVDEGTVNASSGWILVTDDPITVDTTALSFTQFNGLGQTTAGAGLTKTGNTLDVVAHPDGSILANPDNMQVGVLASDAQHGVRGGGTQHALAAEGGAAGFLSGTKAQQIANLVGVTGAPRFVAASGVDTSFIENATPGSSLAIPSQAIVVPAGFAATRILIVAWADLHMVTPAPGDATGYFDVKVTGTFGGVPATTKTGLVLWGKLDPGTSVSPGTRGVLPWRTAVGGAAVSTDATLPLVTVLVLDPSQGGGLDFATAINIDWDVLRLISGGLARSRNRQLLVLGF